MLSAARAAPRSSVSGRAIAKCGRPAAGAGGGIRRGLLVGRAGGPAGRHGVALYGPGPDLRLGTPRRRSESRAMPDQGELFALPAGAEPQAPLAMRLRPKQFEHMVGQ